MGTNKAAEALEVDAQRSGGPKRESFTVRRCTTRDRR
jgi:hypothetical protein